MPQNLVAIDIGPQRARVIVLETTFRRAELVTAHTVELDGTDEDPTAWWSQIKAVIPSQVDSIIASAEAQSASTRLLTFPFEDLRKVDAAIDFELESQVPYSLEEIASTWTVGYRGNGQTRVLAAVSPREVVTRQIDDMREAGLEPRLVVLPSAALSELVPGGESTANSAILSVGERVSHLSIVGGNLRFARTIRCGGLSVDRALAREYKLDLARAKLAKETEGKLTAEYSEVSDDERRAITAVADGISPLVRDIATTFKALPPDEVPAQLWLTGGTSRLPGLAEYLQSHLGIPVVLIDLQVSLGDVENSSQTLGPEYGVAVGLALSLLRRGRSVPLNFRKGDLSYHGDIQVYRGEMVRIGLGLAIVFLLAIAGSIVRYSLISAEESQIDRGFCEASKKIVGREICDPTAVLAILKGTPGTDEGLGLPDYSASALFEMISRVVDKDIDVSFDELEIRINGRPDDPDRITAKGEAASFETTEELVARLQKHPCVQEAEVSKQRKTRNTNRVDFSLTAKVVCPAGAHPRDAIPAGGLAKPAGSGEASDGPTGKPGAPTPGKGS